MLLGRLFRHEQDKKERDRFPVGGVKWHRCGQAQKSAARMLESLDPTVRNGNALTKAGRPEFFPGKEAVEYRAACDSLIVFEKQTGMFEYALLAAGVKIENDVVGTEQLGDLVHTETQTIVAAITMSGFKEDLRRFMRWVGLRQPTIPDVNPERLR